MRNKLIIFSIILTQVNFMNSVHASEIEINNMNAYQFSFASIKGEKINLSDYAGKVILIVNTACLCGFTPQYEDLEELYQKYKDKGLVVIGVPSDDFGGQELDSELEVKQYVDKNFKVTFPLTKITRVKGDNMHPFYKWAADKTSWLGTPKWNFHKYLIGKDGSFIDWFSTKTSPNSIKIINAIEKELDKK